MKKSIDKSTTLNAHDLLLKRGFDALLDLYGPTDLESDPVAYLHRFDDARDVEVAGFIAASLAYGRVSLILKSLEYVFETMEWRPGRFVEQFDCRKHSRLFDGFVHRFTRGRDLSVLCSLLGQMVRGWGSIENYMCPPGPDAGRDVGELLSDFSRRVLSLEVGDFYPGGVLPDRAGVRYFFPSPSGGSACKRLNLFLRWMVRGPDGVDLGIWRNLRPADLVVPMDVHVERIARFLGITRLKGSSWKNAVELTEYLKKFDKADPTKYDFAITRLGILGVCRGGQRALACGDCPLNNCCVYGSGLT